MRAPFLAVMPFAVVGCLGPAPTLGLDSSTGAVATTDANPTSDPSTSGMSIPTTNPPSSSSSTSTEPPSTTSTGPGATSMGSTETSGTTAGGDPTVVFFDDFERPDSAALGNNWVEKTLDAWQLMGGAVVMESNAPGFTNAFIFQPDIDVLDVEVSLEFRYADASLSDFPQVHGRLDPDATQPSGAVRSYGAFVDVVSGDIELIRFVPGSSNLSLAQVVFGDPIVDDMLYRITIRITGDDPVEVEGLLERFEDGEWVANGNAFGEDPTVERIADAGAVGTSGNTNIELTTYDNFMVRDLSL